MLAENGCNVVAGKAKLCGYVCSENRYRNIISNNFLILIVSPLHGNKSNNANLLGVEEQWYSVWHILLSFIAVHKLIIKNYKTKYEKDWQR